MRKGEDVFIDPTVRFSRPELVRLGSHVGVDFCVFCSCALETGDYVHISPHVSIIGGAVGVLKIGHFCTIACGARIVTNGEMFRGDGLVGPVIPEQFRDTRKCAPVILEDFVSIGSNAVVMPGVTLRQGCVVGAGAVVTRSTDPWSIYAGVPARRIRERPKEKMLSYARAMGYRC